MERYTNPDCKPEMEELMKDCPRSRSGAECWLRLRDIEDILVDDYDLDRLRELLEACKGLEPSEIAESKLLIATRKDPEKLARMAELVEADREGRCVVPLCKVGDTVYAFSQMRDKRILPFIKEYEITSIRINKRSLSYYHEKDGFIKIMKQSDFGKTFFLTYTEAEAALRREKDG